MSFGTSSCGLIESNMLAIKHVFSENGKIIKSFTDLNDKSSLEILAMEVQIKEMTSLAVKSTKAISNHSKKIAERKTAIGDLKRKTRLLNLEEEKEQTQQNKPRQVPI